MCQSTCENFFKACDYPKDYWRCGALEYYGGDGPEVSAQAFDPINGAPIYLRSWWPGSPFRSGISSSAICTPGTASSAQSIMPTLTVVLTIVIAALNLY